MLSESALPSFFSNLIKKGGSGWLALVRLFFFLPSLQNPSIPKNTVNEAVTGCKLFLTKGLWRSIGWYLHNIKSPRLKGSLREEREDFPSLPESRNFLCEFELYSQAPSQGKLIAQLVKVKWKTDPHGRKLCADPIRTKGLDTYAVLGDLLSWVLSIPPPLLKNNPTVCQVKPELSACEWPCLLDKGSVWVVRVWLGVKDWAGFQDHTRELVQMTTQQGASYLSLPTCS